MFPRLMTRLSLCLLAICLIESAASQASESAAPVNANYVIVCSRTLRPGVSYRIGAALIPQAADHGIQSVTVRLNTTSKGEKFSDVKADTEWRRQAEEVVTAVDLSLLVTGGPSDFDPVGSYSLLVSIVDTLGKNYSNSTDVTLSYAPVTTLVQTDKAVYKPGQVVKYRIVNVDESLRPVITDMDVFIKDSKSNMVDKQTHNLSDLTSWSDKAVMTGELQLSDLPNEGDWEISVKSVHGTESKTFNVRQYVLPKFTLELKVPSFVHFNDSEFTVSAKVLYTFDKAVEGTFNVTMGPYMNCLHCKSRYDLLNTFAVDAKPDREASFTYNLTNWRETLRSKGIPVQNHPYIAKATVLFKEKFTGEMKVAESMLSIYVERYELHVNTEQVPFFLPGFDIPVQISLLRPDKKPFTGQAASNVTVSLLYQQRGKRKVMEVFRGPLSVSQSGTGVSLNVKIPASADFQAVRVEARVLGDDKLERRTSSSVHPFIGVTDDYVKVLLKKPSRDAELEMKRSSGIRQMFYTVLSRGHVQQWGKVSDSSKVTLTEAELANFVPDVTLVAFGVAQNGEIVASALKHEINRLGGKVSLKSNLTMDKGEPQQGASIRVTAEPESFVFLTGIDASVNLLATGQDILQSTLADRYKSRVLGSRYWHRPQRLTTGRIIQENGLAVLSDAFYYTDNDMNGYGGGGGARSRTMGSSGARAEYDMAPPPMASKSSPAEGGKIQVRKFFPETMVWTVVKTGSDGEASHTFRLPDTVTSWHVTGFGVAADKQIQTMDEAFKVTTFKNFFIRPVLPYSLVRGEKFLLKVLVFNYRDAAGKVSVSLNFTETAAEAKVATGQTTVPISTDAKALPAVEVAAPANAGGLAIFELTPRALPSLEVTIVATFTAPGVKETDVVVKSVIIVPEGKTVYMSKSVLLSPPAAGDSGKPDQAVTIEFPVGSADLIPGSEVFRYSLIGDLMGPAMQNIDSLLRLPSGCGEQNMVNFAPAVFIWEYLSSTKQENNEIKEKATRVMKVGLQRQLTYKRKDGSYSAFGKEDAAGSAWLTAFVLSVYARASAFIAIEPEALTGKSVKFLLDCQSDNGQFKEPPDSRVLDRNLQGSSAQASHGLTAFICLTLLDVDEVALAKPELRSTLWKDSMEKSSGKKEMDVNGSIKKCLWFVTSAFSSNAGAFSSYDTALSVYLLRRAQATATYRDAKLQSGLESLQSRLNAEAETAPNGGKFWSTTDPYWRHKSASVEATSWALLGSALANNTEESLQILRWLSNQQTSDGGFQTSQATVVGIRALAAFAAQSRLTRGDASVEFVINGTTMVHVVRDSARQVLTQSRLFRGVEARVGSVVVRRGSERQNASGFAMATLSWQYNLLDKQPLTSEWKTANGLGIRLGPGIPNPQQPPSDQFLLTVCVRANSSEGMLILRVTNPSGFSANRLPEVAGVSGLKRVETGPREVVMYFDYIAAEGVCLTIGWVREVPVLDLSPQLISLQKYYSTDQIVSAPYLAPELKSLTQCKACPECPDCQQPQETWLAWLF